MYRTNLLAIVALSGLFTIAGFAMWNQTALADAPTTAPAAPALATGHPDISSILNQPAAPSGSLPAGHPDISQMLNTPNSTGAAGSAKPDGINLPAGHPDLSKLSTQTSQPMTSGSLAIRAVQGTPGASAVGGDEFTVELYIQKQLLDKVEGKLSPEGTAVVRGIPLLAKAQPLIKVRHGGVEFQVAGEVIDDSNPQPEVQVPVYETTDIAPDWQIRMRHVMVSHADGVLNVMEMLAVDSPSDRAWIGQATSDGKRTMFTLTLPEGATEIKLVDGFKESTTRIEGNKLINSTPLNPGSSTYQITYTLPIKNGNAQINIASPAPAQTLIVFVPDDGTIVKAQGVEPAGATDMGNGKMRYFKAADVAMGQVAQLNLSGIVDVVKAAASTGTDAAEMAQIVAGTGAAVILAFGVAFIFIKGSPKKAIS